MSRGPRRISLNGPLDTSDGVTYSQNFPCQNVRPGYHPNGFPFNSDLQESSQIEARFGSPKGGPAGGRISPFGRPANSVGVLGTRMINLGRFWGPEGVGPISGRFRGLLRRVLRGVVRRVLQASDETRQRRHHEEITTTTTTKDRRKVRQKTKRNARSNQGRYGTKPFLKSSGFGPTEF